LGSCFQYFNHGSDILIAPLLDKTRECYQLADKQNRGDQDIAAVIEILEAASQDPTA